MKHSTRFAALLVAPLAALTAMPAAGFAQTQPDAASSQETQPNAAASTATQPQAAAPAVAPAPGTGQPTTDQQPVASDVRSAHAATNAPGQLPPMPRTQIYYRAGGWDAFSGQTPKGVPVCGVGTTNTENGKAFSMRYVIGDGDTIFAATKPGWGIPEGTKITIVMQVGLNSPWTLHGTGDRQSIEWPVGREAIQQFDQQFRAADSMTLSFPDGNEPPWRISLNGSAAISDTFGRCASDLTSQYQAARAQGGSTPAVTQPFGQGRPPAGGAGAPAQ